MNEQTQNIATPATSEPPIQQPQMQFQQPMQYQQTMFIKQQGTGKGLAITALIFGLLKFFWQSSAAVLAYVVFYRVVKYNDFTEIRIWIDFFINTVSTLLLLIVLITGFTALKSTKGRGMAVAGLVLALTAGGFAGMLYNLIKIVYPIQ